MGAGGTDPCPTTLEEIQAEKEWIATLERIQLNQLGEAGIRLGGKSKLEIEQNKNRRSNDKPD